MPNSLTVLLFAWAFLPLALLRAPFITSLLVAPLMGSAAATVAWIAATFTNTNPMWLWISLSATGSCSMASKQLRRRAAQNLRAPAVASEALGLFLCASFLVFLTFRAPTIAAWDGRYIWLARAQVFLNDSDTTLQTLSSDRVWAHPEYPPFIPSLVSISWRLSSTQSTQLALTVIVLVTLCAAGLAAITVVELLNIHTSRLTANCAASLTFIGITFGADGLVGRGYADTLLTALLTASMLQVFRISIQNDQLNFSIYLLLFCASLTKQEAVIFGLVLILWLSIGLSISRAILLIFWILVPQLAWGICRRIWSIPNNSDVRGVPARLVEMLSFRSDGWTTIGKIASLDGGRPLLGLFCPLLVALSIALMKPVRRVYPIYRVAGAGLTVAIVIVLSYALGPTRDEISWWFNASFSRISSFASALALVTLILSICAYLPSPARSNRGPHGQTSADSSIR